jgi:hypothetical protein
MSFDFGSALATGPQKMRSTHSTIRNSNENRARLNPQRGLQQSEPRHKNARSQRETDVGVIDVDQPPSPQCHSQSSSIIDSPPPNNPGSGRGAASAANNHAQGHASRSPIESIGRVDNRTEAADFDNDGGFEFAGSMPENLAQELNSTRKFSSYLFVFLARFERQRKNRHWQGG